MIDHHAGLPALQPGNKPQWASRLRRLQRAIRRSDGFSAQPVGKQAIGHAKVEHGILSIEIPKMKEEEKQKTFKAIEVK